VMMAETASPGAVRSCEDRCPCGAPTDSCARIARLRTPRKVTAMHHHGGRMLRG
jgi:hypothetical protein